MNITVMQYTARIRVAQTPTGKYSSKVSQRVSSIDFGFLYGGKRPPYKTWGIPRSRSESICVHTVKYYNLGTCTSEGDTSHSHTSSRFAPIE